ncbi:hypothetical protein [Streptomyces sp. NPDC051214]|uniref:hypothetical protein n=1 Tax=Streptomyces sp. NPDC051214 TaxID=3155282 RepID=UPI00342EDE23
MAFTRPQMDNYCVSCPAQTTDRQLIRQAATIEQLHHVPAEMELAIPCRRPPRITLSPTP